ncbi:MAG: 4-hydroxybenzoate octaprenyltransferase [Phycisphaeraceae bacterium]|nr:4-hydroxybenzoate octaprenyltransferase [Phycisphaeraceae bacterium]MCB9847026.1 4-hydroxybenzoate octaprenyltransferase [Phycisphaeraceae bacterium]
MTRAATIPPATTDAAPRAQVLLALGDIKLHHSVFALPFAVLAAFLALPAEPDWRRFAGQLALVVACMVFARTWAMLVNRIADREIDADNPRTARRALARGDLSPRAAITVALACAAAFLLCCAGFLLFFDNPWPLILGLPTLLWIAFYSFTKRFTALCHVFLGGALAASPVAATIAVNPAALAHTPAIWLVAAMVCCWVAGFDVLYALQDLDFDRSAKLHSIPAALGANGAAWTSRVLHAIAVALLVAALLNEPRFGAIFASAVALVVILIITEHAIIIRRGLAGLPMAFFTINGIVSLILGAAGAIDAIR